MIFNKQHILYSLILLNYTINAIDTNLKPLSHSDGFKLTSNKGLLLATGTGIGLAFAIMNKDKFNLTIQQQCLLKTGLGIAFTAGAHFAADTIIGDGDGQNFYDGQYAWGFGQVIKLSGVCFTVAPLLGKEHSEAVFRWGLRSPVAAALLIAIAHPTSQQMASYIPLGIGDQISTYEKDSKTNQFKSKCGSECTGICNRCFVPKATLGTGIYTILNPLLSQAGKAISNSLGFGTQN